MHLKKDESSKKVGHNLIGAVSYPYGTSSQYMTCNVTRGLKNLPTGQWNHVAITFKQSYVLSFTGQDFASRGNNASLNFTSDLSIEMSLKLSRAEQKMGLVRKGKMSDTDKSVPYQVMIDSDNKVLFLFKDESGKCHLFKST